MGWRACPRMVVGALRLVLSGVVGGYGQCIRAQPPFSGPPVALGGCRILEVRVSSGVKEGPVDGLVTQGIPMGEGAIVELGQAFRLPLRAWHASAGLRSPNFLRGVFALASSTAAFVVRAATGACACPVG